MKSYIRTGFFNLPKAIPAIRELDDQVWKDCILSYLLTYYKETDNNEIQQLITLERQKSITEIETAIKKHIKKWFRKNERFHNEGFILNDEPSSEGKQQGFYDLKFQHSYWNYTKTYFAFECKNLGNSRLIDEYVYVATKGKIDGGMLRYFIDKYAVNQKFGGMIGFVIHKTNEPAVEKLIEKIISVYDNNLIGKLTFDKIVKNSIFDNPNTFDSIHERRNAISNEDEEFKIHHLIMNFID